jgi:hypothetical protein
VRLSFALHLDLLRAVKYRLWYQKEQNTDGARRMYTCTPPVKGIPSGVDHMQDRLVALPTQLTLNIIKFPHQDSASHTCRIRRGTTLQQSPYPRCSLISVRSEEHPRSRTDPLIWWLRIATNHARLEKETEVRREVVPVPSTGRMQGCISLH